jgi:hypothetical protein
MYWNHRVVKTDTNGEVFYEIQEVYYNDKDEPCGYCDPCVGGDDIEEIRTQIQRFTECLSKPILEANKDFNGNVFIDDENEGVEEYGFD